MELLNPDLAVGTAAQQDIAARRRAVEALSKSSDPEARRAKLRESCEGFEAIFLQKMWEQMRATLPKEGIMHSKEEEFWQSMYDQELGKSMAASGGIGLADMMMRQLDRNDGAMSDATRDSAMRRPALDVPPAPLLPSAVPAENAAAETVPPPAAGAAPVPGMGTDSIYEGEAPQAGEAPAALPDASGDSGTSDTVPSSPVVAEADMTPPSVRQTLDELAAQAAVRNIPQAASQTATPVVTGTRPVGVTPPEDPRRTLQEMKGEAPYHPARSTVRPDTPPPSAQAAQAIPADPVVTRITYQTNLPPSQRKASPFARRTEVPAAPYTAAPLSTAASATGPGQPEALPAPAAAETVPPPAAPSQASASNSVSGRRATPGVPAPGQDILAGIRPRYIPSRLTRSATPAQAVASAPAAPLPSQAGGPALRGPEDIVEPVALGNPAPPRGSLASPVSGEISSGFGWRLDPFTGRRAWHAGVDIKAAPGESVRAARPGVVSFTGEHAELGNLVVVDHGDGLRTFYGHNRELDVRPGQRVDAGTELAKAGASGRAAGTHVHFEVRRGDLALNPEPLLRQRDLQVAEAR